MKTRQPLWLAGVVCCCVFLTSSPVVVVAMAVNNISSCAVVGVGVLGTSLCRQLLEASPDCVVTGITKTSNRHDEIRQQVAVARSNDNDNGRFRLVTADQLSPSDRFENVVFCAPPSGFDDYPAAVKESVEKIWAGPDKGGVFVFTSSGAVYGSGTSNTVTESSALADPNDSPRIARLVNAEKACLNAGGCSLRLAGLYSLERGPHNFWLTSGKGVSGGPNGIVNLLHYDDAAGACLAALQAGPAVCHGKAFLISDGHPMTRMQICESALKAKVYENCQMPEFLASDEALLALGKIYDGTASNQALNWKPKYESFDVFMISQS